MLEFTEAFPGTHITSWVDDEDFDMVTVGIPGDEVSTLWVGDYEEVETVWDCFQGYTAPRPYDKLWVALDEYMERTAT